MNWDWNDPNLTPDQRAVVNALLRRGYRQEQCYCCNGFSIFGPRQRESHRCGGLEAGFE